MLLVDGGSVVEFVVVLDDVVVDEEVVVELDVDGGTVVDEVDVLDDVVVDEDDVVVVLEEFDESSTTFATATPPPAPARSSTNAITHTVAGLMRPPLPPSS